MSLETLVSNPEFERIGYLEVERKFVPRSPELFEHYKSDTISITQAYLSAPTDDYSLRLRKVIDGQNTTYSATLKSRGDHTPNGLARMEIDVPIAGATFDYYMDTQPAMLHKQRAEPLPGVTIDWIDGSNTPIVEIENIGHNEMAAQFLSLMEDELIDRTGQPDADNEALAYALSGITYEATQPIDVKSILEDVAAYQRAGYEHIVLGIAGRSGSGKTTLASQLDNNLRHMLHTQPLRLSTDDYHVGRQHLEATYGAPWSNWEAAEVYDTKALAEDIKQLKAGQPIKARHFDFTTEETVFGHTLAPSNVIIVEGIHAGSPDLASVRQMFYDVKTPLATSLGRDIKRLLTTDRQNDSIRSPEDRLRYIIETGEPTYQSIEHPRRNSFSASVRPLGAVALHKQNASEGPRP
jgi:uridine kinase